jgi:signal transduction histidine kinase
MLDPLRPPGLPVALVFEEPGGLPALSTDETKLSRVLQNFLSNALKFTERGEVRLRAEPGPDDSVVFSVSDTGIGIEPGHLESIFEEFGQVDGPLRRLVKGSGLGLPLVRKLAHLLGGRVDVQSRPGVGSTFSLTIPARHHDGPGITPDRPAVAPGS